MIDKEMVSGAPRFKLPVPFCTETGPAFNEPIDELPPNEGMVSALDPPVRLMESTIRVPSPASRVRFLPAVSAMPPITVMPSPFCAVLRICVPPASASGVAVFRLTGPLISKLLAKEIRLAMPAEALMDPTKAGTWLDPSVTIAWLSARSPATTSFTSPA